MKPVVKKTALASIVVLGIAAATAMAAEEAALKAGEVNVYSYRQPFLVQPLFDAFTEQTGIKVNVLFAKTGLVERLKQEGINSPADVIFTVDIGRLSEVYDASLTQPVASSTLTAAIPDIYREPEGHWYGLTRRARIIYASRERISPDAEDLRRIGRSEVARAHLHALGQSRLSGRVDRGDGRPSRRSKDRSLVARPQGKSRPQAARE
jgi:hypothetical protein